ncbi:hypothetical protein GE21DRAFT_1084903 [Neurospora crassa]|nr:hypothetical protein GE21DRAFT_1084903 [Neurospora crassa]
MAALASELEPSLIPSLPGGSNGSRTPTRTGKALRFLRYIHTLPFAVHPPRSTRPSQRHGASTPALSHLFHFFSSPPPPPPGPWLNFFLLPTPTTSCTCSRTAIRRRPPRPRPRRPFHRNHHTHHFVASKVEIFGILNGILTRSTTNLRPASET